MSSSFFYSCTKTGLSEGFACAACGVEVEQEEVEALGHEYDYTKPYATKTAATCIKEGEGYFKCTREGCDDYAGSQTIHAIPVIDHEYTIEKVVLPTCAQGYTEHFCKNCGNSYKDTYTDAIEEHETLDHFFTRKSISAVTGATPKNQLQVAVEADTTGTDIKLVDENGEKVTKAPTKCSESCIVEYKCNYCKEWITLTDAQYKDHDISGAAVVEGSEHAPTCTEDGYDLKLCKKCNKPVKDTTGKDQKNGHSWSAPDKIAATCTTDGYSTHTCTVCGVKETIKGSEELALGHSWKATPTSTDENYDPNKNAKIEDPTCTEAGYGYCQRECCKDYVVRPATGHKMTLVKGREANCTSKQDAYKDYYTCSTCNGYFEDELGSKVILNADGEPAKTDKDSSYIATWKIVPWAHTFDTTKPYTEATCTTPGTGYCTKCKSTAVQPANGHEYGTKQDGETYYKAATCKTTGYEICKVCGDNHTLAINPNAHKYDIYTITTEATCTSAGEKTITCSICDAQIENDGDDSRSAAEKTEYPRTISIEKYNHKIEKVVKDGSDYKFECSREGCTDKLIAVSTSNEYVRVAKPDTKYYRVENAVREDGTPVYFYYEGNDTGTQPVLFKPTAGEVFGPKMTISSVAKLTSTGATEGREGIACTNIGNMNNPTISDDTVTVTSSSNLTPYTSASGLPGGKIFGLLITLSKSSEKVEGLNGYTVEAADKKPAEVDRWNGSSTLEDAKKQFIVWLSKEACDSNGKYTLYLTNELSTGETEVRVLTIDASELHFASAT